MNKPKLLEQTRKDIVRVILDLRFTITLVKRSPEAYPPFYSCTKNLRFLPLLKSKFPTYLAKFLE
jgi:hypothetical protein